MEKSSYKVYMLRCDDGSLYTGIAMDVERRFAEHASGGAKAARYTRAHRPVEVVATFEASDRREASALEYRIKRLSRSEKLALVENPSLIEDLRADIRRRARRPLRILMLGNSLTTAHGIPDLMSESLGAADVSVHARGGARLAEHLNPKTRLGGLTQDALRDGRWDYVVLQEMSNGPVRFRSRYLEAAAALCNLIREAGARPVIYATWAYSPGCPKLAKLGMGHEEMHALMHEAFAEASSANGALLADAGQAFFDHPCKAELYAPDGVHPSPEGARLAASALAAAIR